MDKFGAKKRIELLRKEIDHHRYLYHVLDQSEISDSALDSLKNELVTLERQYPEFLTPDSPSQRVAGAVLDKFHKVKHQQPVLSLQDVFSVEEIADWQERNLKFLKQAQVNWRYFCELKLDGLTVVLRYKNGVLISGATRGDGSTGEEVLNNLKTIESIPLRLRPSERGIPEMVEVRGEVVMLKSVFEKLNKQQEKNNESLFANPRNVAAGSIRQLDPSVTASRKLVCFAFELISDCGQKTHEQSHQILQELGFKINPNSAKCQTINEVKDYLVTWVEKRKKLDYQTDGVVIVVNELEIEKKLGSVGKAQRWMAAYKFPAEQATTRVLNIIVQVGRTGALTPVAVMEPVRLAGTTVSRATLHNADEIERLDLKIGDTVIVQKAGDIIPEVLQVLPKLRTGQEKKFVMPKKCPVCGAEVVRKSGEVNYYCSNKKCFAVELEGLQHFVSKRAFNIDGLGPKILEQLVAEGLISGSADLFELTEGDLAPLERFGEKSAQNIVAALNEAKKVALPKFIYALGIRHAGEQTAISLARHFHSLPKLLEANLAELEKISDIGPIVAASIYEYFQNKSNLKLIEKLQSTGVKILSAKEAGGKLAGQTFVLTGSLSGLSRNEAKDKIESFGGTWSESVSKEISFVVVGEKPGSKFAKAKSLGVSILTEAEFLKMVK
ncbi:MAG: NAD-dependent DNA ligase LigA [Candidatus Komeilibacteria bacterium]|nr:NAD-dependent DNA ligase LigA [Candidatus Komeilibacteria bacterium]